MLDLVVTPRVVRRRQAADYCPHCQASVAVYIEEYDCFPSLRVCRDCGENWHADYPNVWDLTLGESSDILIQYREL